MAARFVPICRPIAMGVRSVCTLPMMRGLGNPDRDSRRIARRRMNGTTSLITWDGENGSVFVDGVWGTGNSSDLFGITAVDVGGELTDGTLATQRVVNFPIQDIGFASLTGRWLEVVRCRNQLAARCQQRDGRLQRQRGSGRRRHRRSDRPVGQRGQSASLRLEQRHAGRRSMTCRYLGQGPVQQLDW